MYKGLKNECSKTQSVCLTKSTPTDQPGLLNSLPDRSNQEMKFFQVAGTTLSLFSAIAEASSVLEGHVDCSGVNGTHCVFMSDTAYIDRKFENSLIACDHWNDDGYTDAKSTTVPPSPCTALLMETVPTQISTLTFSNVKVLARFSAHSRCYVRNGPSKTTGNILVAFVSWIVSLKSSTTAPGANFNVDCW
ncbi:hypothetical protein D9758_012830 [Tetrapyrgos nigripes]|uniref:Uncharacterized protein n=1 Tax=Tetrapyrgos nigripes TaxID=182062 RepID=A0A8H5CBJ6_9AGAR|nr:hypothetical protein D9758_012830 [Tetrapyrgos nigripes]